MSERRGSGLDRRSFVRLAGAGAVGAAVVGCRSDDPARTWEASAYRKPPRSRIAILPAPSYREAVLEELVVRGIELCDLRPSGRRVVLKPNLVEFDPNGVINTNPALVAASVAAFRRLGAREVVVAEGPGHRRDTEYLLERSGLGELLRETGARYVDLNHDAVRRVRLRSRFSLLDELYLPTTVLDADLLVSMPKMKTHHWAGVTLSMKNLFGIVPGSVYGWPKNALHWAGIEGSIVDLNAALDVPRFAIVDGVVGMEGNGPIQGEARRSEVLVFGRDPVAVDATASRLMSLDPWRIGYLADLGGFLGNVGADEIELLAEALEPHRREYRVLDTFLDAKASSEVSGS